MSDKSKTDYIVTSLVEVAKFFGRSRNAISANWIPKSMPGTAGPGAGQPGRYDLSEIAQWREVYLMSLLDPQDDEERELRERLEVATVRKAEASATIEEIRQGELENRLIDRVSALAEIEEMFNRIRARIQQIPQEVGTTFPPEVRADLINQLGDKLRMVLMELASWADE